MRQFQQIQQVGSTILAVLAEQYSSLRLLRERRLAVLAISNILDVMSATIIVPFLPSLADKLGASPLVIGLIFTIPAIVASIISAPAGYVADRIGRRPLIWGGVTLSALPVMAISLAWSPLILIVLRAIDSLLRAFVGPAMHAYVGDSYSDEKRGSAFSVYQTTRIAGAAIGPVVGGAIAQFGGIRLPFFILGAGTLVGGLILFVFLPAIEDSSDAKDNPLNFFPKFSRTSLTAFLTVPAMAWLVNAFLGTFGEFALNPIFPLLLEETVSQGPAYVGSTYSALAVAMLVFMPIGGRFADRVGRVRLLVVTKFGWFVVMIGLATATSPLLPPVLMFFGGVLSAFAAPASMALRYEIAPTGREATFSGMTGTASSVGKAAGPLVATAVMGMFGVRIATIAAGFSWLVAIPVLLLFIPRAGDSDD